MRFLHPMGNISKTLKSGAKFRKKEEFKALML
jgi:hypothetical protein